MARVRLCRDDLCLCGARERREGRLQNGDIRLAHELVSPEGERLEDGLKGIRKDPEGEVLLEFCRPATERLIAAFAAALQHFADQRRLADARLTGEDDQPAVAATDRLEQAL